ncbi:MAG: hypothetical protein WCC06_11560 [Candidatus Aminicenantales bacterium]
MVFNPCCLATAIGSFPNKDADAACRMILDCLPEIPLWPQLPQTDFREEMEIQYSEGLPAVVLDEEKKRMFFDISRDLTAALERFYENYMAENMDFFKISPAFSRGIYAMENHLARTDRSSILYFKSHLTGPVTTGLGRVDETKRAIYYNDVFRDILVKGMEMKARWLIRKFRFLERPQICFIDEPILSAFGSSTFVTLRREEVIEQLQAVIGAVHKENALAGIHCCGNTDWTILVDAGVDIISFDAYGFSETIAYYPEKITGFLECGGILAWGIVPTSEKILQETAESLVSRLKKYIDNLAGKGMNKNTLWERCLLTPSCGTGSISEERSDRVFSILSRVSQILHP